ncbi:hypothetical protein GCM10010145_58090 [Streptomyces ruber]|uniref:Transposase IS701-like DDE domain-containing protein n=2 Tax=Streptomyces TaxID=1883 RepID=A0A918BMN6_9ACTN|nr:transposase [Streptomyces ruber]GGQ80755.1 hypothetical protein GCM10010145_58090 [Streptomyces ruber]
MRDFRRHVDAAGKWPIAEVLAAKFRRRLFGSLHRNGQRVRAEQYVRRLLSVRGRKTLRSMAARFVGASAQQSVHHFVTASPWEWTPIRHAPAHQAQQTLAPEAWTIGSTLAPRAGSHPVGADPQPTPLGAVNGRPAVGTRPAPERSVVPVDRELRLSARWTADPLRDRAGVPADAASGIVEECVRQAVAGLPNLPEMAPLPVVVDAGEPDGPAVARHVASPGRPFVVRVSPAAPARIDRTALPEHGDLQRTARELAELLPHLRQQVDPGDGRTTAVAVPVPASPTGRAPMTLVAEWCPGRRADRRLWLTAFTASCLLSALRSTRLPELVERHFPEISDGIGLRNFAERAFPGRHRHITLACISPI